MPAPEILCSEALYSGFFGCEIIEIRIANRAAGTYFTDNPIISGTLGGNREIEAKIATYIYAMRNGYGYYMGTMIWRAIAAYVGCPSEENFNEVVGILWLNGYDETRFPMDYSSFNTQSMDILKNGCNQ